MRHTKRVPHQQRPLSQLADQCLQGTWGGPPSGTRQPGAAGGNPAWGASWQLHFREA